MWGCSQEESNHRVHEFFGSEHFASGIPPVPGALEALRRLREQHGCDLVVVTSRQFVIRQPTIEWVEQHFPAVFSEVHIFFFSFLSPLWARPLPLCFAGFVLAGWGGLA